MPKVFEELLHTSISKFPISFKIIFEVQYGFGRGIFSKEIIADIIPLLYMCLNKSEPLIEILLDLAKAFDTLDYTILCKKQESIRIRGLTLEFMRDYLIKMKQFGKQGNCRSKWLPITKWVSQCTILGIPLFVIYVKDIFKIQFEDGTIFRIADTVALYQDKTRWKVQQK